eukprot:CFRG1915T1
MDPMPMQGQQVYQLSQFWSSVMIEMRQPQDFKTAILPLARIKKIMKLDEDVKMISAEALILFSKALEIFIRELGMRSWGHTEENKRRTLQRNDIAMAVSRNDTFDFLIDIVPRDDIKSTKRPEEEIRPMMVAPEQLYYYTALQQQQGVDPNQQMMYSQQHMQQQQQDLYSGGGFQQPMQPYL